ncbi:bolA-like protein DDB_G0274169 isoform X1 [Nilaparvata lugens]|uniref:bolA-like protein DDB_G0274169 isoform X1 n=2 Tax=Nilaparvata lugens TaxID=108931 RepID=UPI00193E2206|nr:bolA-like protein DDB_G0274169 isoform X1 [Nilaparvata lugens]
MNRLIKIISVNLSMIYYRTPSTSNHYCTSKLLFKNIPLKMSDDFPKPVETAMRTKLAEKLTPVHLEIINESFMHNVPKGAESHFKVVVVSDIFNDLPLLKRHRLVNEILDYELKNQVHALSIVAKTPEQWEASNKDVEASPACRGGFGK